MRLSSIVALAGGQGFFEEKKWCGGKSLILLGVFENSGVWTWCFGGENVVGCVVDVVFWMVSLRR
jgi:hypothetical protein